MSTIVVGTHQDDTMHWLRAGRAAQRLVLAAAGFDVAASLCEPATRVEPLRRRLPGMLGLPGPVQVVLRLGYPHRT